MLDYLNKIFSQLFQIFNALSPKNRIFVAMAIMLTILSLVGLIVWSNRADYKILYTGLSSEDAGAVISSLRQKKVPFKIGMGGSSIMVPGDKLYELRMELARDGLPQTGGIGYEIFDKQNIGVTEFVQKVNLQRALQGELARTISQFVEVKKARVHLTIPEKSLFIEEQEQPRASIVLNLYPGKTLSKGQIQGVMNLVASSVEGLPPENVFVIDAHGKLLGGGEEQFMDGGLSTSRQQLRAKIERNIETKIETMLDDVVGPNKITAKVSVDMDFTQVEQTQETYDPEKSAVRSEQSSTETSSGSRPAASGIPGVMSNSPELEQAESAAAGVKKVDYNKKDETINYEITRVTKRIVNPVGTIERLNVAVLIDGTYTTEKDEQGNEVRKYASRTDEEMKKYEALVKRAVGFNEDRDDSIEVVNVQFHELALEKVTVTERISQQVDLQSVVTYIITALLFALFFVFGLRPIMRLLAKTIETAMVPAPALPTEPEEEGAERKVELPSGLRIPGAEEMADRQSQLIAIAQKNPRLFAQYLKGWMAS